MFAIFQGCYTFLYTISGRISSTAVLKALYAIKHHDNSFNNLQQFFIHKFKVNIIMHTMLASTKPNSQS